jgi:alkylation response protein AidB-like acyl-CoA dehydrogenase
MVVDMHSPGVEVRPIRHITGDADFNEIFFENVEVPVENVLDEVGNGWAVAMTTLLHERGTLGFTLTGGLEVLVNKVIELAKERDVRDSRLRDMVAREWIELQALKLTNYRSLTSLVETGIPGPEGSGSKLQWSEAMQRSTKLALEIQEGEADAFWRHGQLRTRGNTIEAGTSEILRNIIAERVLGLPRSR